MSWVSSLSKTAAKQLQRLSRDHQLQVGQAIEQLEVDPFAGDVIPIKSGSFQGALRKRAGRYRIIFSVNRGARLVEIAAILPRSEKTYR